MTRHFKFLIAASLAVTGSCLGVICYARPSADTMGSWDGFDSLPKRGDGKVGIIRKTSEHPASDSASADEAELVALKPYSPEWWSVRDAIDRTADEQLARKLIICRGCLPSVAHGVIRDREGCGRSIDLACSRIADVRHQTRGEQADGLGSSMAHRSWTSHRRRWGIDRSKQEIRAALSMADAAQPFFGYIRAINARQDETVR